MSTITAYVPWSFETRPMEVVWVWKKGYISDRMITAWKDNCVEIGGYAVPTYEELFQEWQQRDGSPCGQQVEPPAFCAANLPTDDLLAELHRRKVKSL